MHWTARLTCSCLLSSLLLFPTAARAAEPEFNWLPSGTLVVGNLQSEAAAHYEGCGDVQTVELAYRGEQPQKHTGRIITGPETFVIQPASYRGGAAPTNIVLVRCVDSAAGVQAIKVELGTGDKRKELGVWSIYPPAGDRHLYDALYVIPKSAFVEKNQAPAELTVRLTTLEPSQAAPLKSGDKPTAAAGPFVSLGYRFYATRDWDVLGADLAGSLATFALDASRTDAKSVYVRGLVAAADHDYAKAAEHFAAVEKQAAGDSEFARLAHAAARRVALKQARQKALAGDAKGPKERPDFAAHYRLGMLAGAWGCWDDALTELQLAMKANPLHADATYRLAEAMEYCRMPVAEWAPLYERAGFLGESDAMRDGRGPARVEDVLIAVHGNAVRDMCGQFSPNSFYELQRDWRYVEQQVYGASRGAWKVRTHWRVWPETDKPDPNSTPWVMQARWIFLPSDREVPVMGTYDYSIGTAEYGSSHAGGVDCGVNGAGGAQIGPTRSWEVWLHEWNHEFDWVCVFGEQVPGYPPTHDSDGCGKQPIVSMGCGHRSSMHYYINRGQYGRHMGSDPVVAEALIPTWERGALVSAPKAPTGDADALAKWLVEQKRADAKQIEQWKKDWEGAKKAEQERAAKPPVIKSEPDFTPVPDWAGFLTAQWNGVRMLKELAAPDEAQYVCGATSKDKGEPAPPLAAKDNFVDLRAQYPQAPDKCVGYARTFIYSPVDQEVRFWLGFNDTGAFWLNGRPIYKGAYYACAKWEDQNRPYELANAGKLQKGWNCLAAKIERGGGDWGFSVHVVDFQNRAITGLKYATELPKGEKCAVYTPPAAGASYRWAEVGDDYLEKLPQLGAAELQQITGIKGLELGQSRFFLKLPAGTQPVAGSRYVAEFDAKQPDRALNNYLDWDTEAAAALRYTKDGATHDLVLVRPEYMAEFLTLLGEKAGIGAAAEHVLGYAFIPECDYATTPGRGARAVLVIDAQLPEYPAEDVDLLTAAAGR